jgi:hypothetical protein
MLSPDGEDWNLDTQFPDLDIEELVFGDELVSWGSDGWNDEVAQ